MSDVPGWVRERLQKRSGVIGALLYGSYALGMATEGSDVDLLVIVAGDSAPVKETWCEHGLDVELHFMTLPRWQELPQTSHWQNFGLAHGRPFIDPRGIIAEGLKSLQTTPLEHRSAAPELLDTYLNSTYRSVKAWRRGDELGARLHAGLGATALLDAFYRLAGVWTPYWDRLEGHWAPLSTLNLDVPALRDELICVVKDASDEAQIKLYQRVSTWMREAGYSDILGAWNDGFHDLLRLQG